MKKAVKNIEKSIDKSIKIVYNEYTNKENMQIFSIGVVKPKVDNKKWEYFSPK